MLPFEVTLLEELLHNTVVPLAVQLKWLCGIAKVWTVDQALQYLAQKGTFHNQSTSILVDKTVDETRLRNYCD